MSLKDRYDLTESAPFYQPGAPEQVHRDGRHFKLVEFACPLTKAIVVSAELLEKLDELRERIGRPLTISSGYRSPEYNRRVGGAERSQHLLGRAADIPFLDSADAHKLLALAEEISFRGIGLYPTKMFIHLDVRPGPVVRWARLGGKAVSFDDAVLAL